MSKLTELFDRLHGSYIAVCLDQHSTTGITLELYKRYKDDYKTIAYFEGSTIKDVAKKAHKFLDLHDKDPQKALAEFVPSYITQKKTKISKELTDIFGSTPEAISAFFDRIG